MLLRHSLSKPKPRQNWAIQNEFRALYSCQVLSFHLIMSMLEVLNSAEKDNALMLPQLEVVQVPVCH